MNQKGFSVIESLIVIVILGIVLIIGLPFGLDAMANYRAGIAVSAFTASIQRVRYLATYKNEDMVLTWTTGNGAAGVVTCPNNSSLLSKELMLRYQIPGNASLTCSAIAPVLLATADGRLSTSTGGALPTFSVNASCASSTVSKTVTLTSSGGINVN